MQTRQNSPKENPSRESLSLKEGKAYTLIFVETINHREKQRKKKKRMRLLKCYRHHAIFEDEKGMQHSFRYWDIEKLLLGEPR